MTTGKDGRTYDSHYDYDKDGSLNAYERMRYEESFKNPVQRGKQQNPLTLMYDCGGLKQLIAAAIWALGFLCMCVFPPLGAAIILVAIGITEQR